MVAIQCIFHSFIFCMINYDNFQAILQYKVIQTVCGLVVCVVGRVMIMEVHTAYIVYR